MLSALSMLAMKEIEAARAFLAGKTPVTPRVLLVLGSGLGSLAERVEGLRIPYEEIPHFPRVTVEGHAGYLALGKLAGVPVAALAGRFHYYEGYPLDEITFPIRALAALGASSMIVTNAAGGINTKFEVGDLMLITDHINFLGDNPLRGGNIAPGPRFPDMSRAYDADYCGIARSVAKEHKIPLREGVYVASMGPCYETPAEIRMYRAWGGDAAGMSTVPEVIVARHAGVRVLGITAITNMAAGILPQPLSHAEVIETTTRVKETFAQLVLGILAKL